MVAAEKSVDPRVKRTRKLLQQAFIELFQEKDFSSISIQDITERATVNRATFYAHFQDKYALMDSVIREEFQHYTAQRLPPTPTWDMQSLHTLTGATFNFLAELHHECKPSNTRFDPLMERAVQEEIAEILLYWLKQAKSANTHRRIHPETLASAMSWTIFGTAVQWSRGERKLAIKEMINEVLQILTEGGTSLTTGLLLE